MACTGFQPNGQPFKELVNGERQNNEKAAQSGRDVIVSVNMSDGHVAVGVSVTVSMMISLGVLK